MQFPIDRRTAFGGMAGAAFASGVSKIGQGEASRNHNAAEPMLPPTPDRVAAKLAERPSVRDKGAKGDGVAMDGAAIQDALNAFSTLWVPGGTYLIDVPLTLPSYSVIAFASDAIFCPAHDGMTIFNTKDVSYSTRVLAPRIHARGKGNVTAFDLNGFRHRSEIQHADILECAQGIVLRSLCWDTLIHMPWIRQTANPIVIANGSNAVDVVHPGIDGFDVGIKIETGPQHTTTSTRIWGGYVQNGRCGIVDEGCFGTVVDGTYFEGMQDADILLARSIRPNLSRTQHYASKGRVAIQMMGVDGATVIDPLMSSGSRNIGLYDIDESSRNVTRFESMTAAGVNQPLGKVGLSGALVREEGGVYTPVLTQKGGALRYERQKGRWRRSSGQMSVAIELSWRGVQPGGALVIAGLPAAAQLSSPPLAALTPAIVTGSGSVQAYAQLGEGGVVSVFTLDEGQLKPLAIGANGSIATTITCLF